MNFLMRLFMGNMAVRSRVLGAIFLLLLPFYLLAQTGSGTSVFPPKPEPAVYVHDFSGWLSRDQQMSLEQKLRRYHDSTSTQIVVMIRPDLGDYDKSSYAFELGNRWGIGRKDKNNGVVMLVKSEAPDRGIFIATGYGTEGALPDITCGQIIRNVMSPYFRQQQYYAGIDAGVDSIIKALSGEFKADGAQKPVRTSDVIIGLIFFFLLIFGFFYLIYRLKKAGSRWGGGGGSGGGGWWIGGGGGGSSWGSSSSSSDSGSSWGGGGGDFGGGSFGGGGAGGDW
jgi:uncharacterized protein